MQLEVVRVELRVKIAELSLSVPYRQEALWKYKQLR